MFWISNASTFCIASTFSKLLSHISFFDLMKQSVQSPKNGLFFFFKSRFFFIRLLIIRTLRIESSHRYRISFVVFRLLKDSALRLAAYQPPFKHPRSRIITSVWSVIGLSRPRTATPTDFHLLSSRSACCVLPPLGSCSVIQGESWHGLCFPALSATYLQNNRLFKGNPRNSGSYYKGFYRSLLLGRNSINQVFVIRCHDLRVQRYKHFCEYENNK